MTDGLDEVEVAEEAPVGEPVEEAFDAPMATLTLKRGGVETDIAFRFASPAIVGRFDPAIGPIDVDLGSIDESVYVSRKHAQIDSQDGIWRLLDLGSSNGTFLLRGDFERIDEVELPDGAEVAFGNARFVFRIG